MIVLTRILASIITLSALIGWSPAFAEIGIKAPTITNETWLNSAPLHESDLKGKVVLVEFWTFG